jgi:hypothetical protein
MSDTDKTDILFSLPLPISFIAYQKLALDIANEYEIPDFRPLPTYYFSNYSSKAKRNYFK